MEIVLISISLLAQAYLVFIGIKYGIQKSISASVYCLPLKQRPLFTIWSWLTAIPMVIVAESGWLFFAGVFLTCVGVASLFRKVKISSIAIEIDESLVSKMHMFSAKACIILGYGHLVFTLHLFVLAGVSVLILAAIYFLVKKNTIWWVEVWAFASILAGIGIG